VSETFPIVVVVDPSKAKHGSGQVMRELDRIEQRGSGVGSSLGDSMGGGFAKAARIAKTVGAAVAVKEVVTGFMELADANTTLENRLKAAGVQADKLTTYKDFLKTSANELRVSVDDLADRFGRIAFATKHLGVTQLEALEFTESLTKAMKINGGSAESMNAAMTQLIQGLQSGVLRGEELNSVMEQFPVVADIIAKGMGTTTASLRKMGEAGEITARDVMRSFQLAEGDIEKRFSDLEPTYAERWQQIKNTARNLAVDVIGAFEDMGSGIKDALGLGTQGTADEMRALADQIEGTAADVWDLAENLRAAGDEQEQFIDGMKKWADAGPPARKEALQMLGVLEETYYWLDAINKVRGMKQVQDSTTQMLTAQVTAHQSAILAAMSPKAIKEAKEREKKARAEGARAAQEYAAFILDLERGFVAAERQLAEERAKWHEAFWAPENLKTRQTVGSGMGVDLDARGFGSQYEVNAAAGRKQAHAFASDFFGLDGSPKEIAKPVTEAARLASDAWGAASQEMTNALLQFVRTGEFSLKDFLGGLLGQLTQIGMAGLGRSIGLPGYATGGAFTVGGTGGTDSQPVAFMATPGERVIIQTPQQQAAANSGGGGGGGPVNVNVLLDRGDIVGLLDSPEGGRAIVKAVRMNRDAIKSLLG